MVPGFRCPVARGILALWPGVEPASPALEGRFLTTGPPVLCLVAQLCQTLCDPMDCSPPGSSVQGILQAGILEWVAMPSSRGSSQPRDQTQVSHIAHSFLSEPPGKAKNTGVGSLSLLQRIFSSQESNLGLGIASGFFTSWATGKPP